jgi:hypothetical protein
VTAPAEPPRFAGAFFCRARVVVVVVAVAAVGAGRAWADYVACGVSSGLAPATDRSCAIARARAAGLARTRDWQVLLHYRPRVGGGWKSEAAGLGFFLAGRAGQTDPEAELVALLVALFDTPAARPDVEQPQCLFPARTAWVRATLGLDERALPTRACPTYATWRTGISAEAVTLVYTTAFLNSPASMYGHTFLRLSRATGEGNPLLDYIVNFAADVTTTNGFVYALKGTTGGFAGRFFVMPYYVKVQEYSNIDSRDLWEYELALTKPQVERLVAHAWETRTTTFDYYFFRRNCSYQLLELLEAAVPALHLTDGFWTHAIPSDTVRVVLRQPGLVVRRTARPAILSSMKQRRAWLRGDELASAERWALLPTAAGPLPEPPRPAAREALVLDAAYDYMRFREGLKNEPSDDFKRRERRLFLARGRTGVPPVDVVVRPETDAPEEGHATMRLSAGGGWDNASGAFERLSLRAALHDYLDPPVGYPADATLVMGNLALRYDDDSRRLRLDRLDALDIVSAVPYDRWVHGVSWKVWVGADNARELGCDGPARNPRGWSCLYGGATTGGGVAARFGRDRVLAFAFADTDLGAGPAFSRDGFRLGLGGEAGLVGRVTPSWQWQLGGRYIYYPFGTTGGHARVAATQAVRLGPRLSLQAGVATAGMYAELWSALFVYL